MRRRQKNSEPGNPIAGGEAMRDQLPQSLFDLDLQETGAARDIIEKRGAVALEKASDFQRHRRERRNFLETLRHRLQKRIEILAQQKRRSARYAPAPRAV